MQGKSGRCHFILSTNEPAQIQIAKSLIGSTHREKVVDVKIDSKLSYNKHIKIIWKKSK